MISPLVILSFIITAPIADAPLTALGTPFVRFSLDALERIDPAQAEPVFRARAASVDDIRAMLRHDDSKVVSLGIDAASYRCRPDLLVEASWLVGDTREALPRLVIDPGTGKVFPDLPPFRIGQEYAGELLFWFHSLPQDDEPLRAALAAKPDPWAEVGPWRLRLDALSSGQRAEELAQAKRELQRKPESLQWILVTLPQSNPKTRPAFTEAEIKAVLDSLSPETKQRIADRTIELPKDYQLRRESGARRFLESLFDRYDELTAAPARPDIRP
ncbi:MAG: hypothetical protein KF684_09670 [Phycisphaeraceae bacterium]|nr:hypothetical protein [Phycisphaeraceae bacterium]